MYRNVLTLAAVALCATLASGQSAPSRTSDVERLRAALFEAENDVARLRTGDIVLTRVLRLELSDLREQVRSFAGRLQRGDEVARDELQSVGDRVATVRRRARGRETVTGTGGPPAASGPSETQTDDSTAGVTLERGTGLVVRLLSAASARANADALIEAAVAEPVSVQGRVVIPVGALVQGAISSIEPVEVTFTHLTVNYRVYTVKAQAAPGSVVGRVPGEVMRLRLAEPLLVPILIP